MSRWSHITVDHLRSAGHGKVVDQARGMAVGGIDPAEQEIINAVSRVRSAIKAGNVLDADTAKVPLSLVGLTTRLAFYFLSERIRYPLTKDQSDTKAADNSYLLRITDKRERFEAPDEPSLGEMQTRPPGFCGGENPLLMRTHPVPRQSLQRNARPDDWAGDGGEFAQQEGGDS